MSDLKGFERDLAKFGKSIGVKTELVIKKIALETFRGIVIKTPVKTGRARASWVITLEHAGNSPTLSKDTEFSEEEATAYAFQELAELSKITPFSTVFISNNLPYIETLEDGNSQQKAPEGMVAVTLEEIDRDINRITSDV